MKKLLKFLGLFTTQEYALLNLEYNNQRDLVSYSRARIDHLEKELLIEREERKFLQDLILKRFGLISSEGSSVNNQEELQPIKTSPRRWSDLKAAMERDDHARVQGSHEKRVD